MRVVGLMCAEAGSDEAHRPTARPDLIHLSRGREGRA